MLPLLLALAGPAFADDAPLLVSAWQARNDDAVGLAGLLEDYLARELEGVEGIRVLRVEDTPAFRDYSARVYMDGCPPGNVVGCTQVVADRGGATYALTGTVQALAEGSRVEVDLLDVNGARVMVTFTTDLAVGEDAVFAEGVAKVVAAALRGEIGREVDIREGEEPEEPRLDNAAMAAQLAELSSQLSEAKLSISDTPREVRTPEYTVSDLADRMQTEGSKPWERLGMTPGAYLRYRNSGLSLLDWRRRAVGRQGQLLVKAGASYWSGPLAGEFYGAYTVDGVQVVDSYSWQAVKLGSGAGGGIGLAYGITPAIEVGIAGGVVGGSFTLDVDQLQTDRPPENSDPETYYVSHLWGGARVQASFFPVSRVRPTATLGVDVVQQHWVGEFYQMPASIQTFPPQASVLASLAPGGEASLSRRLDLYLQVPIDLLVAGGTAQVYPAGGGGGIAPPTSPAVSWRVQAGLQVRLFGVDVERDVLIDDFEEP